MTPASASLYALMVFAAQMAAWFCGQLIRRRLPAEHLSASTRDSVMVVVGVVATLSALVLGLMISSAKASFDSDRSSVIEIAGHVLLIDRALVQFGEPAKPARSVLRDFIERAVEGVASSAKPRRVEQGEPLPPLPQAGRLQASLLALTPATDGERWLQARALTLSGELERARVLFVERAGGSIPPAFLIVLTAWLAMLYLALAMFAPNNATATATALGGSLAFAAAIFLILELDTPFHGVIRVSTDPLVKTLQLLGQ